MMGHKRSATRAVRLKLAYRSMLPRSIGVLLMVLAFSAIAAESPADLPQVTVSAQRKAIESQVRKFVDDHLYLENAEGPTRWNSRVCPTVIGLLRDEGEFILQRLSQIGRAAGVPLDGEQCKPPNLYVIATTDPDEVLRRWGKKTHWRIFGDGMPHAMDAFIDTPRPVRAWYNSSEIGWDGSDGSSEVPPGLTLSSGETRFPAHIFSPPGGGGSRITRDATWTLTSVIVVIDKTKLHGVTRGQLADYIAMNAFSRLKPGGRHGSAPTILDLFENVSTQPPTGLTAWDEAFLESLYHTNPTMVQQPMLMASRMVKHIVPETPAYPSPPP